ncbi:MAG: hypothetical protein JRI44_06725 [Deltaproteobacteria bacterium]|nr:hypothetical protein [Deltaproteobacteria bacterium]
MIKTNHFLKRCKQRGFRKSDIELLKIFGTKRRKPGGVFEYLLTKKDKHKVIRMLKQIIQRLDRLEGKAVLINEDDNSLITIYPKR